MSTLLSDDELLARLRQVLKSKNVSLRRLSEALEVPYRSVQNYLGGETRMPAAFLMNVCWFVGLEPGFLYAGDFRPSWPDLYDAVGRALAQVGALPEDQHTGPTPRAEVISKATAIVSESYDRFRHDWLQKRDGGDNGRRPDPFVPRSLPSGFTNPAGDKPDQQAG